MITEKNKHLTRESYFYIQEHRSDQILNSGFDYKGKMYELSVQPRILEDSKRRDYISKLENMVYFLLEKVKLIKTWSNYAVPRDHKKII